MPRSGNDAVGVAAGARFLLVGGDRRALGDNAVGVAAAAALLLAGRDVGDDGGSGEGVHLCLCGWVKLRVRLGISMYFEAPFNFQKVLGRCGSRRDGALGGDEFFEGLVGEVIWWREAIDRADNSQQVVFFVSRIFSSIFEWLEPFGFEPHPSGMRAHSAAGQQRSRRPARYKDAAEQLRELPFMGIGGCSWEMLYMVRTARALLSRSIITNPSALEVIVSWVPVSSRGMHSSPV